MQPRDQWGCRDPWRGSTGLQGQPPQWGTGPGLAHQLDRPTTSSRGVGGSGACNEVARRWPQGPANPTLLLPFKGP
jgi:hypothetical protein